MRLATRYADIHSGGAEAIAIGVDNDVRQARVARRWGLSHTKMVSDPGGENYLKALGVFDPDERGIALPGPLIIDPAATRSTDTKHAIVPSEPRTTTGLPPLGTLDLPPVDPEPWAADVEAPSDLTGFFRPQDFRAYLNGNMFGAIALAGRITDSESRRLVHEHRVMARSSLEAWEQWRPPIA